MQKMHASMEFVMSIAAIGRYIDKCYKDLLQTVQTEKLTNRQFFCPNFFCYEAIFFVGQKFKKIYLKKCSKTTESLSLK